MTGDHLVFISVAAILIFSVINTLVLRVQYGWRQSQAFWFWGLIALSTSYSAFGLSVWIGRPALSLANFSLLVAYLAMCLQLRFWRTGKTDISVWLFALVIGYMFLLESFRYYLPYTARVYLIHTVMTVITAYLFWSAVQYYRTNRSKQLIVLATTFVIEFMCSSSRLIITLIQPELTNARVTLYEEPIGMVAIRWIWLLANAMSYMTVMTYELEKTINKNETLGVLLQEKNLLLNALSRINRSDNSAAVGRSLSHELRQPLTTLLLATRNLQLQLQSNNLSELSEQVDFLCLESERSANLINQLEELFCRPKSSTSSVGLAGPLNQAIKILGPRLSAENINLRIIGNLSPIVAGESSQLETIFINLISNSINALAHTNRYKNIDIVVTSDHSACLIEVRDNGTGIDASVLPNIWALYITGQEDGTGIGLWLSQQIAQILGGEIEAGNRTGAGAWFRLRVPIKD